MNVKQDDWSDFYNDYKIINKIKDEKPAVTEPEQKIANIIDEDEFYNVAPQVTVTTRRIEPIRNERYETFVDYSEEGQERIRRAQEEYQQEMLDQAEWEEAERLMRSSNDPMYEPEPEIETGDYSVESQEELIRQMNEHMLSPIPNAPKKSEIHIEVKDELPEPPAEVNVDIEESDTELNLVDDQTEVILGAAGEEHVAYIEDMENDNIGDEKLRLFGADGNEIIEEAVCKWQNEIDEIIANANDISKIDVDFKDPSKVDLSNVDLQVLTDVPEMNLAIAAIRYYQDDINSVAIKYKQIQVDNVEVESVKEEDVKEDKKAEKVEKAKKPAAPKKKPAATKKKK